MPANAPFASGAMLQYIATLVGTLPGLQQVYIGVPESIASKVSAYVTMGDLTPTPMATQTARRTPEVMVTFAYRVVGAEQTAELLICDLVDALTAAIYADRSLGGTSQNATLSMLANTQPRYIAVAGSEFRTYITVISGLQTTNTP